MSIFDKIRNSLTVERAKNAVQQTDGLNKLTGYSDNIFTRDLNPNSLFWDGTSRAGKYDNYYGDSNKIVSVAAQHPIYYVNKKNDVIDPKPMTFAYYLDKPNEDYPLTKVLEQIYTELITHGQSDLFLWRKDGRDESRIFEDRKKYNEDDFRGITLVSGYDRSKLTKADKENIIRIQFGASQSNVFLGYSPSQAAQSWRKMQDEMGLHMTAFARNAGMPLGKFIITAPSPEDYAKMRDKLDDKIAGAKNNGKILYDYRPSDSKVTQIEWVQFTSQDVQDYTSQLEFAEKKMTQSFGVPGTIKGTNDGENYATARVSEQVFIKYTIKPLVDGFKEQLAFAIEKRFNLTGELKIKIDIPEIADESKIRIEATKLQVELFDQKRSEGYSAESIVAAYSLPESFLLLESAETDSSSSNSSSKTSKTVKNHSHEERDEFLRSYQNDITEAERAELERDFRLITTAYADDILSSGYTDTLREEYEGKMTVAFGTKYQEFYEKNLEALADTLVDTIGTVDISDLNLTDEELAAAQTKYRERVDTFSKTFAEGIEALEGDTLEVKQTKADSHIKRVVVTETEHTRIISELNGWEKAEKDFPVRVYKTWKALPGACPECSGLDGTTIDVTSLFVKSSNIKEVYEITAGGYHPNCRCICVYEMDIED